MSRFTDNKVIHLKAEVILMCNEDKKPNLNGLALTTQQKSCYWVNSTVLHLLLYSQTSNSHRRPTPSSPLNL